MIQTFINTAIYTLVFFSCVSGPKESIPFDGRIVTGAERMQQYMPLLTGKSVGLVVNQTSMIYNTHLVDVMNAANVNVVKIFTPEHGFRGEADAGEKIENQSDPTTGIPLISLYGKTKKPSDEDLSGIDVLLFDIQDVGVRFYTYISTLHYVMEAAAENGIDVIVLDRPNPNGHYIDGPVLKKELQSFVGMHEVPVVYGMTIGEYARMINGEKWLSGGIACKLTVISCVNYNHKTHYILPVKPSPNLPNPLSVALYPSLCFFEGTTVSIGRGTEMPFQIYGHPDAKATGFSFTPQSGPGSKYPKHEGVECHGYDLRSIQPKRNLLDLTFLITMHMESEKEGFQFFNDNNFFDLLAGTESLKKMLNLHYSEEEIRQSWQSDINAFKVKREKYLLYD